MKADLAVSGTGVGMKSMDPAVIAARDAEARSLWKAKRRYIAMFLFANLFINYMDRATLSVAAPAIANQFRWNPTRMGLLFSSFLWTYWLCLIPWGAMVDRMGARKV